GRHAAAAGPGGGRAGDGPAGGAGSAGQRAGRPHLVGQRGRIAGSQSVRGAGGTEKEVGRPRCRATAPWNGTGGWLRGITEHAIKTEFGAIPWLCRNPVSPRPAVASAVRTTR